LREFKATFLIMVCELELKYDANYIETFAFKQLACYVHWRTPNSLKDSNVSPGLKSRKFTKEVVYIYCWNLINYIFLQDFEK